VRRRGGEPDILIKGVIFKEKNSCFLEKISDMKKTSLRGYTGE